MEQPGASGLYLPGPDAPPAQLEQQQQRQLHQQQLQLQSPAQLPTQFMSPRTLNQHPYTGGAHHHHHHQQLQQQQQHHHLHLQPTSQNLVHKQQQQQQHHYGHHHHHHHHHHHCGQQQFRLHQFAADYAAGHHSPAQLDHRQMQVAQIKSELPAASFQGHHQLELAAFGRPPSQLSATGSSPVATPTPGELAPHFRPRVLSVSGVPSLGASQRAGPSACDPQTRQHSPLIIRSTSFSASTSQPEPSGAGWSLEEAPPSFHQHQHQLQHQHQPPPLHSSTPFAPSPAASSSASSSYAASSVGHHHHHRQHSSMSPSDALNLGINLEQYISKRNERERSRVRNVNDAFDNLKNSLPLEADKAGKRMSKVEILRTAIGYIKNLEQVLGCKQSVTGDEQRQPRPSHQQQDLSGARCRANAAASPTNSVQQSPAASSPVSFSVGQHRQPDEPSQKPEPGQDSYVNLMRSLDFGEQQQQQPFE